jgi:hypothetical protein
LCLLGRGRAFGVWQTVPLGRAAKRAHKAFEVLPDRYDQPARSMRRLHTVSVGRAFRSDQSLTRTSAQFVAADHEPKVPIEDMEDLILIPMDVKGR